MVRVDPAGEALGDPDHEALLGLGQKTFMNATGIGHIGTLAIEFFQDFGIGLFAIIYQ